MSSIFISHSSRDNTIAQELERRLARQGHASVFLDLDPEKGIAGGQSWERTLYRKVRACRAVIALVTDSYLQSQWCFAEIALARMEGKHLFALTVDPLSAQAKLPSILTEKQYIDLRTNPDEGYARLWRGLREVDVLGVKGEWDPHEAPYLGFDAFQEKHAPLFFGREDEARAGVELLDRGSPGLVMTLGASGSGKSSLVRAAIVPRLRRLEDRWIVVEPLRPGHDPFAALAAALLQTVRRHAPDAAAAVGGAERLARRLRAGKPEAAGHEAAGSPAGTEDAGAAAVRFAEDERVRRLMSQLRELRQTPPADAAQPFVSFLDWTLADLRRMCDVAGPGPRALSEPGETPLIDIANELRLHSGHGDARVLVVVDQFEELLGEGAASDQAKEFLTLLRQSVEAAGSPVMVLGTMRSDYLGQFQRHPALRGMDFESLSLGPMSSEGIRRVIEEPAKLGAIELQAGLTDRLMLDTETPDALPLLSFTLWVLWRDFASDRLIELSEYDRIGGLQGAVAREAEALVANADKAALRRAFLAMVRLTDDGLFARRQVAWDAPELVPVHAQLEQFVSRRLLVVRSDGSQRVVEVAHEALFRTWALLQNWLDQGRAELLLKQQIARDAIVWETTHDKDALWRGGRLLQARELLRKGLLDGRDKSFIAQGVRQEQALRWTLRATTAAVCLGLGALAAYALVQKKVAEVEKRSAVAARERVSRAYEEMVAKVLPLLKPKDAVPGPIDAKPGVLRMSAQADSAGGAGALATLGLFGRGRVLAVAHDTFISAAGDNRAFLDFGLRWLATDAPAGGVKLLYSVGHCEVVSDSAYPSQRIARDTIRSLGYEVGSIRDLADLDRYDAMRSVLVVGNAWGAFTAAEVDATQRFVARGGSLMLVGLFWSWDDNKAPGGFDPCTFNPHGRGLSKESGVYPMNALGEPFGITFAP